MPWLVRIIHLVSNYVSTNRPPCSIWYTSTIMHIVWSTTGSYEKANKTIDKVLQHAKSIEEKIPAYSYQILCKCDQTFDYKTGASDCVTVLNMYGFGIPSVENMSKAYMMKEEMKVKAALRYRSYSCLTKLPFKEDPIFALFVQGQKYSSYSGNDSVSSLLDVHATVLLAQCVCLTEPYYFQFICRQPPSSSLKSYRGKQYDAPSSEAWVETCHSSW